MEENNSSVVAGGWLKALMELLFGIRNIISPSRHIFTWLNHLCGFSCAFHLCSCLTLNQVLISYQFHVCLPVHLFIPARLNTALLGGVLLSMLASCLWLSPACSSSIASSSRGARWCLERRIFVGTVLGA